MKRILLRLILTLLTFAIGIYLSRLWVFSSKITSVPIPQSQEFYDSNFPFDSRISKNDKRFWNKEILVRFREKSLEQLPDSVDESYRLILIPTFDAPVTVRAWRFKNQYFLVAKKTNGEGGFGIESFGKVSYEKTRALTEEEWLSFIKLLDQSYFWDMPSINMNNVPEIDGATWIIEGNSNRKYHEVHRTISNKEFRESCAFLLKLADLENEYKQY